MRLIPYYRFKSFPKRLGVLLFDLACGLLPPVQFEKALNPDEIKKILVIRNDHLGDVLMTLPAFFELQKAFPLAQYDFIAAEEVVPLLKKIKSIDKIIPFKNHWYSNASSKEIKKEAREIFKQIKQNRYDLAIDFRGDLRNIFWMRGARIPFRIAYGITGGKFLLTHCPRYPNKLHQIHVNFHLLKSLGIQTKLESNSFSYTWDEKKALFDKLPPKWQSSEVKKIVIHPSAGCPSKIWPHESMTLLIQRLIQDNTHKIILIGTEKEKASADFSQFSTSNVLDLRGKTKIEELPILFDYADLFIGHDSGPSHLAAYQGTPLVILFSGANDPSVWCPWAEKMDLMTFSVPCSPCESKICPLGHHDCLKKISVEKIHLAVRKSLAKHQERSRKPL